MLVFILSLTVIYVVLKISGVDTKSTDRIVKKLFILAITSMIELIRLIAMLILAIARSITDFCDIREV